MRHRRRTTTRLLVLAAVLSGVLALHAAPALASPVCTDGYRLGPPRALCGGRVFPEAALTRSYVQYTPDPATGFAEYRHGLEYLAELYPRWIRVFTLRDHYADDDARSAGFDAIRAGAPGDTADGQDILVVEITDHAIPNEGKDTLLFSLSVHGNERGGLEGGVRTAEDLAIAAETGGTIVDGVDNYDSTTGREPEFTTHKVADVLAQQVVYLVDFNIDGWRLGDTFALPEAASEFQVPVYGRGNGIGTDLNRQMPTVGRINSSRNPLEENEMAYGTQFMHEVAAAGVDGLMAYGADVHGELTSRAYVDVMYPAGEFDSVDHRRLMAIAERTKSVIDATLYAGIQNEIEEATGGNEGNGLEDLAPVPGNSIPTMPAHWATVWDTLGYTDTGFIGDYMATDLAVTGMDYEIFLNHTVPERVWNVYLQENHINATRAIIKTAMAYALTQAVEFNTDNVVVDPVGRAGFVFNPDTVTDTDQDGPGTLPGPGADGIGRNGEAVEQRPYEVTNQQWFVDTSELMADKPFVPVLPADIANDPSALKGLDTLVLADITVPADAQGRPVDAAAYWDNIEAWVRVGGNLVLTDRGIHGLGAMELVDPAAIEDIRVYQPYANITDFTHPMVEGLRPNARQLVEAAALGYGIGNSASPMTIVDTAAFTAAGGHIVGTTGNGAGSSDDGTQTSVGELALDAGLVRIVGGALPTPTEELDHRYGLRNYGLTYSGLYIMENAIKHDADALGTEVLVDVEIPDFGAPVVPARGAATELALTTAMALGLAGLIRRRLGLRRAAR